MEAPAGRVAGEGQRANKSKKAKRPKNKKSKIKGGIIEEVQGWSAGGAALLPRLSHAQMFGAAGGEGRGGNRGAEKVRDTTSSDEKGGGEGGEKRLRGRQMR